MAGKALGASIAMATELSSRRGHVQQTDDRLVMESPSCEWRGEQRPRGEDVSPVPVRLQTGFQVLTVSRAPGVLLLPSPSVGQRRNTDG